MPDLPAIPHSPSTKLLGWRMLHHDQAKGFVRIGFEARPEFLNPAGFVQGGILAAMLHDCMGPAAWIMTRGERFTATIDMTVSYLAPAKPGPFIGEGQVVRLGGTIAFLEGRLFGQDGELLVRATSSARLVDSITALARPARSRASTSPKTP